MKWADNTTFAFVQEYLKHECLYNSKCNNYRIKQVRDAAIIKICEAMNISDFGPKEAVSKIKSIRSTYSQELRKINESTKSGAGTDDVYVPILKWFTLYHDVMKNKFLSAKESESNLIMPRNYIRKTDRQSWSVDVDGMPYKTATKTFSVPLMALKRQRAKGKNKVAVGAIKHLGGKKAMFTPEEEESSQPPVKVFKSSNFGVIKRCCISLVRDHGRPVEMFDDQPFRELVNLLPLTSAEKRRISAQFVQKLVDGEETDDDDMDLTADKTADDQEDDDMPIQQIKGEMDVVVCACKDGVEGEHDAGCPAAASALQTYWNYFEVSMDEAKCTLCQNIITWSSISKLKEHLQAHHPNINFLDDDENFEKGPPSSVGSREDLEQVYVDPFDENILKKTSKKRKKVKQQLLGDRPITRENIASSLDRFKSLDCFGNYVASLMKLIPKDKCVKFQIQIVERLLQEQAAAA